ncbi:MULTISPECIES: ATP-binding protein [unclassified Streptomyces]|uniref:ATP-binding protein n=1 Tax=unclassified Streptomyces TaxID=2593676 RepID=UPI00225A1A32|nr:MULTISPECIES: ATP-binding protein [unclassified Streptomyces]MCX4833658.1 ATP-binding protein [Streptomyces sp. NBC_01016]
MVSVQSPPGGREVPYLRVLLLPAMVMAAATGAAAALVAEPARAAVALCGALGMLLVLAVSAEAVRRGRVNRAQRAQYTRHVAELEAHIAAQEHRTMRVAKEVFPHALYRMASGDRPHDAVRNTCDSEPAFRDVTPGERELMSMALKEIDNEITMRDAAQRAFVSVARRVQAIVHKQAEELREMEEDHGRNPEVFDDLLRVDHGTALIGRLADSVTVLGGARPGRQWPKPVKLYSVLRGAMSRILEYPRIDLHAICDVAIRGVSVEPVIHACAELLDNATRYSPPTTRVHVTAVEVQTGIAIEIEDGGVSLSEDQRRKTEAMLDKAKAGYDLNDLGENPRLGLAIVGRLCAMYDMQISLRQSAYGGVRAVLVVPRAMMSTQYAPGLAHGIGASAVPRVDHKGVPVKEEPRLKKTRRPTTGPRPVTGPRPSAPLVAAMEDDVPVVTEWRPNGLPQRRRKYDTKVIEDQIIVTPRNPDLSMPPSAAEPAPAAYGNPAPAAAPPGQPDQHGGAEQPEPGLWVEAFMNGLKPEGGQAEAADAVGETAQDPGGSAKPHDDAYNQQVDEGDHQ